ncbi:abortive infection family protein [Legionella sainthelensi]|uniref:abortive infection family protein n=1 Tax=Legionella sainthelensi TaxID=28087 RepID=UPI000E1FD834|nr:abortive infection family protein [Legionella sainthelensi]
MSDLSYIEKRKLERLLRMGSGYVLNFNDRTYRDFFADQNINIDDEKYYSRGTSKANRLRAFWEIEDNYTVGKVIEVMILYGIDEDCLCEDSDSRDLTQDCFSILQRLKNNTPVTELGSLVALTDETDFKVVAEQVRYAIQNNQPESGLDRLHTFINKFIRVISQPYGIEINKTKSLHAIFGEYIKALRVSGRIESEMTDRILKSSISILESFNYVRNDKSLAHDNPILNYEESMLIFNHIAGLVRFIKALEHNKTIDKIEDEIPF